MTSPVALIDDKSSAGRNHVKLTREFGPVLDRELKNPRTEDILLNPDGAIWVKRIGEGFSRVGTMQASMANSMIGTIAYMQGGENLVVDRNHPVLETTLPIYGSRFEGLVAPVVANPSFAIRMQSKKIFTIEDYESAGILTNKDDPENDHRNVDDFMARVQGKTHAEVLRLAAECHRNILVVGSTGSGKTTLGNAILHEISRVTPNDRVILIEDTPELQCGIENSIALLSSPEVSMLACLRACMRLKPTRIVVGEVRGQEALSLLKAWNTGHPGGFATVHANDAVSGLIRMESLVAEATAAPQQKLIAEAVDIVVFIDGDPALKSGRKVKQVIIVTGYENGRYEYQQI